MRTTRTASESLWYTPSHSFSYWTAMARIFALFRTVILLSFGFNFLKKFLWCFVCMQWLNISSLVPQAALHPSRLHVYIGWSRGSLGLLNSVMYSNPIATCPLFSNLCRRVSLTSAFCLSSFGFLNRGAFGGSSIVLYQEPHAFSLMPS